MNMNMNMKLPRQAGIALPVMLLMVLTMAITSIYLIKSVNLSTINATNAAYESALVRAADLGLHEGYDWLRQSAQADRASLNTHRLANGYRATFDPDHTPNDDVFWANARQVASPEGSVQYVIHRMCSREGRQGAGTPRNACVLTTVAENQRTVTAPGDSIRSGPAKFRGAPQVHYLITARLAGVRGGTGINQMVVLIGV